MSMPAASAVPSYLADHAALFAADPRAAHRAWFAQARFGLFIHYGLYALMGRGEWVQYREAVPVAEYATLADTFTAKNFDADRITDLACEAGMRYVTMVTCHHEGFTLWDSDVEPFNTKRTAARRDLVGEMVEQCRRKGLGFFAYYTFMLNWRFPHFLSRRRLEVARPNYAAPQPGYLSDDDRDFLERYVPYMQAHLRELLTRYGPIAGVWLDIIIAAYLMPELTPVDSTYRLIRELNPTGLLAYKQGVNGEEDFASPERRFHSLAHRMNAMGRPDAAARAEQGWAANQHKHNEICTTLQKGAWGFQAGAAHLSAEELWQTLGYAHQNNCNLLANIGPLPDGSVHPEDVATLKEVGRRIRAGGYPDAGTLPEEPPAKPAVDPAAA